MSVEIVKQLRKIAITKQVNFLLGSGTSVPAIPLMGAFRDENDKSANEQLFECVQKVSKKLLIKISVNWQKKMFIQFWKTIKNL